MLFGGNLVRQPAFVRLRQDRPEAFRVVGDLARADQIMRQALFVGTCVGVAYGFNNRPIPLWFPMLAALVSSLYVVGPALLRLGEPGGSVAMAGFWAVVHVLPALGVWLVHHSVRAHRLRARTAA